MRPFFVTGFGASGTRWLAKHLDQKRDWKVWHEDGPHPLALGPMQGVVSSLEREYLAKNYSLISARVDIAVIVRDPLHIVEHAMNKGTLANTVRNLNKGGLRAVKTLLELGAYRFDFKHIIIDPRLVTDWLGWDPLPATPKIGHQPRKKKLSEEKRRKYEKMFAWFRESCL